MNSGNVSRETFLSRVFSNPFLSSLALSEETVNTFYYFFSLYSNWNTTHNLSSISDLSDFVSRHIADSLLPCVYFDTSFPTHTADLGSGGGFPGIPLSYIYPESFFYLFDTVRKKTSFLKSFVFSSSIKNVSVHKENFFSSNKRFDCILVRGVRLDKQSILAASNFLSPSGVLLYYTSINQKISLPNNANVSIISSEHIETVVRIINFY